MKKHLALTLSMAAALSASGPALLIEAQPSSPPADTPREGLLGIGSPAPAIDIEHWIHTRNGAFGPITGFQSGKVYVLEFWATWCGPCIAAMPHLAKLQDDYADQGVQIIGITNEDPETARAFLETAVPTEYFT